MPSDNKIPWRGDSTLRDGCDYGTDLSGGWFDGEHNCIIIFICYNVNYKLILNNKNVTLFFYLVISYELIYCPTMGLKIY